jgi:uncharacterized LabA/DUF88 family protein
MAFVDAGYLTAGAGAHLKLEAPPRIDGDKLALWGSYAWKGPRGGDLLRTYVYDGEYPSEVDEYADQRAYFDVLGAQPGIRLRLGHLTWRGARSPKAHWEQKGVDTLIVLDLVRMAQLGAFDTAMIVAGDADLAEAVRVIADDYARRVILYSVEGSAPAKKLLQAADDHQVLTGVWLRRVIGQESTSASQQDAVEAEAPHQT